MSRQDITISGAQPRFQIDAREAEQKRVKKICDQFEALFIAKLLQSMRTSDENGLFGDGFGADTYQSLFESQLAEHIASTGKIGIAEVLYKSLFADPEKDTTVSLPSNFDIPPGKADWGSAVPFRERMRKFDDIVDEASKQYDLPRELILAVIKTESYGDPFVVSRAGAKGLMQLMDETAADLGVKNSFDPRENILAGTRYLRSQLDTFGNLGLALAAYNAGPSNVIKYNGIPPFEETRNYVQKVLASLHEMREKSEKI